MQSPNTTTVLGLFLAAFTATGAMAETKAAPIVVVELYTSQGCSSCPPADDYMAELVKDDRVMPLSLHVDYWDYIGWADSFADPKYTDRQHSYARAAGSRLVYTPQMIVGGLDRVEGNNPAKVAKLIAKHLGVEHPVALTVTRDGNRISIHAESTSPLAKPVQVQIVHYLPQESVQIERGENAGRTITYYNIVTSWERVGDWVGAGPLDMDAPLQGSGPAVVILQEKGPAAILAAARVE